MTFFYFFSSFLTIIYLYAGFRIIPYLFEKTPGYVAWAGLLSLLLVLVLHFYLRVNQIYPGLSRILAWAGYTGLGFVSFLFCLALVRDLIMLFSMAGLKTARLATKSVSDFVLLDPERRRFLYTASGYALTTFGASASAYGFFTALKDPEIVYIQIPSGLQHRHLKGLKIAQFTDLHVGPTVRYPYVKNVCDSIQTLKADLIVFTGDLADGSPKHLAADIAPLKELNAPMGNYFVTGNHEYYSGVRQWLNTVENLGFEPLVNTHKVLEYNGGKLVLGGVTDIRGGAFYPDHISDPIKAMDGAPDKVFKLLLAHQPTSVYAASEAGVDLQLSGHTHGGQYFPFNYVVRMEHPFVKGMYQHKNTRLYVSQGSGYWGPPLRLGTFPEITVFTFI